MLNKGDILILSDVEKDIINLIASKRQSNKVKSNLDGKGQVNNKKGIYNNKLGFAGEFLFCKHFNLFPDFTICNTSKILKTDNGDALLFNKTVDVKTSCNEQYLMTPKYSKSNIELYAKFYLDKKNAEFIFQGFATNKMLFNIKNLKTKFEKYLTVDSYVLNTNQLLNYNQL